MQNIAFIDLEASGLSAQSWPIEVGWCFREGAPQAYLVRPAPAWSEDAWDERAQALHGVSYQTLKKYGEAPENLCALLNTALTGCIVYSDAPDWDGFWLYRLFQAGGQRQTFSLTDFRQVFKGASTSAINGLVAKAAKTAPHRHRASADVLHMKAVYALAARGD